MVDSRPRLHGGRLFAGMGMGPRIREDNGRGRGSSGRELGRKMDCRPRLHGGRLFAGDGDGSPHPRGQWEGARHLPQLVWQKLIGNLSLESSVLAVLPC